MRKDSSRQNKNEPKTTNSMIELKKITPMNVSVTTKTSLIKPIGAQNEKRTIYSLRQIESQNRKSNELISENQQHVDKLNQQIQNF